MSLIRQASGRVVVERHLFYIGADVLLRSDMTARLRENPDSWVVIVGQCVAIRSRHEDAKVAIDLQFWEHAPTFPAEVEEYRQFQMSLAVPEVHVSTLTLGPARIDLDLEYAGDYQCRVIRESDSSRVPVNGSVFSYYVDISERYVVQLWSEKTPLHGVSEGSAARRGARTGAQGPVDQTREMTQQEIIDRMNEGQRRSRFDGTPRNI